MWADPLGPSALGKNGTAIYGTSGAPQMRSDIFNYMKGLNPNFAPGQSVLNQNVSGAFLHGSPELDRAMASNRAATMGAAADATARLKSEYARNGMNFSTGMQQAAQGARTAAGAEAGRTAANTYLQNYANERANQNASVGQVGQAPLNYLTQKGNIVSSLSSGGQVITPESKQYLDPSKTSTMLNTYATIMGGV